jgi:hypothetical protein
MSNTSKADLCAEIAAVCKEQGKPLPEGLETLKQLPLFDLLEELTGKKDPRRPNAGVVRTSSPPPARVSEAPPAPPVAPAPAPAAGDEPPASEADKGGTEDEAPAAPPPAPPAPPPELAAPAPRAARSSATGRYIVAEGKVVHCLKGPIGAFQEIRAMDLSNGEEGLDALFADGTIVAAKR